MNRIKFIFVMFPFFCFSQNITILSEDENLGIPFATVLIKSNTMLDKFICDSLGVVKIGTIYNDSTQYVVTVKSSGYLTQNLIIEGLQLKSLQQIRLKTMLTEITDIVVTAQYEPKLASAAVQRIKIINAKTIEAMGAVNLRDVLTNQLNIRIEQDNILGAGLSFQGVSSENVKILLDGVPIIGRLNGNIDLSQINLNNVERIEIIEGPLSVQYGTNALAGTINIISKKNLLHKFRIGIATHYESIGTYNMNLNASFSKRQHFFQLLAGRNYFDGWTSGDNHFVFPKVKIADSSRYKEWKPREQYFAELNYKINLKKYDLSFKSSWFQEKILNRGYPKPPYGETTFDDTYYTLRLDNSVSINARMSRFWTVKSVHAFNYYNRIKKNMFKDLTTLAEIKTLDNSNQDSTSFELYMSRASFVHANDSSRLNYELGYDVNYENATGKRIDGKTKGIGDFAIYATMEYQTLKKLIIKPAIRFTYNTLYKAPVVPSLSIRLKINQDQTIRFSYARGFRSPSIKELYFYFVDINHNIIGNTNLEAESSNNYMLSYNFNKTNNGFNYKMDISGFYNEIVNLITLAQISTIEYSYVNIGKYKTVGSQISNGIRFKKLDINFGVSYIGRYNELSENEDVNQFNFSPEFQSNMSYNLKKVKTVISLFFKYNGVLPNFIIEDDIIKQNIISDHSIFDATIVKQLWKNKINITAGCKNILNVRNILSSSTSGTHSPNTGSIGISTGRNYFIRLILNIEKIK